MHDFGVGDEGLDDEASVGIVAELCFVESEPGELFVFANERTRCVGECVQNCCERGLGKASLLVFDDVELDIPLAQ